jgi:hypothetical protein
MPTADLRPMSLGEVLDRTFTLYRENFLLFTGIMALPYLALLVIEFLLLVAGISNFGMQQPRVGTPNFSASMIGGAIVGALAFGAIMIVLYGIAQAATIWAVSELYLGRSASVRSAYLNAKGRVWPVILVTVMVALATVLVGGFFFFLLFLPGLYLACRLALSVSVTIVEKESPVASMERSMELTKGNFWQIFALLVLVGVISSAVSTMLQMPVMYSVFTAAMAQRPISMGAAAYQYVAAFIAHTLVGPIGTISVALMYYNLRVRKEGFDIQHLMNSLGSSSNAPRPLADLPGIQ